MCLRACASQQEKPLQWEACAPPLESSPCSPQLEKSPHSNKDPTRLKINKIRRRNLFKKKKKEEVVNLRFLFFCKYPIGEMFSGKEDWEGRDWTKEGIKQGCDFSWRQFQPDHLRSSRIGDLGSIPGSGRSPGQRNSYPLQYSCLENSMDRGTWQAVVHGVAKSLTWPID